MRFYFTMMLSLSLITIPFSARASKADTGSLAGAILGGMLGSKVGKGNGRVLGAVVGAVAGGVLGHEIGEVLDEESRQSRDLAIDRCLEKGGGEDEWQHREYRGRVYVEPAVYQYQEFTECRTYYNQVMYGGGYAYSEGVTCRSQGQWVMVRESRLSDRMPRRSPYCR